MVAMKLLVSPYTFSKHFCDFHFNCYLTMPTANNIKMALKAVERTLMNCTKRLISFPRGQIAEQLLPGDSINRFRHRTVSVCPKKSAGGTMSVSRDSR